MKYNDLPLGFVMALAQNENAVKQFEQLDEDAKDKLIEQTHHVKSKKEMQNLVNGLTNSGTNC